MSGDKTSLLPLPKDMRDFNMATPSLGHLFSFLHVTGVKKEKIPKSNRIYFSYSKMFQGQKKVKEFY